jgi:hypothetical protein
MNSTHVPFALVHADIQCDSDVPMTTCIKNEFLSVYPDARIEFRKTERLSNGNNVHVFWILVPYGTESHHQSMLDCIGNNFYQGNGFVVYKWKHSEVIETPRNQRAHIRYKIKISSV